jgi:hypothetical protein
MVTPRGGGAGGIGYTASTVRTGNPYLWDGAQHGNVKPDGRVGPLARALGKGEGDLRRGAAAAQNLDFPCSAVVFMARVGWVDGAGHRGIVPHVEVERAGTRQWSRKDWDRRPNGSARCRGSARVWASGCMWRRYGISQKWSA